jgi:hypothetical protein
MFELVFARFLDWKFRSPSWISLVRDFEFQPILITTQKISSMQFSDLNTIGINKPEKKKCKNSFEFLSKN